MTKVLGKSLIAPPNTGSTQTFITVGAFDTQTEAEACDKYINTKFAKAMLSILKVTQHNPPSTWAKVPLQDFSAASDIDWLQTLRVIDAQLYRKYGLSPEEIHFIEENIEYYKDDLEKFPSPQPLPKRQPTTTNDFAKSKIFKLMLDLQRLAQFDTSDDFQRRNTVEMFRKDFLNDEDFYRKFDFTPEIIQFTEENYHDARQ